MIDLNLSTDIITDSNNCMRRFFRCWLDGSYNGEGHYHHNCDVARENYNNDKALRSHVISEWCDYLAAENECSRSTVQRHMVNTFTRENLDRLNVELIDDLRDLVADEMECGE
jgi:hypothetical protein